MNKRRVGADKERQAAEYLTGKGMQVLETNFRCRQGEIDLICRHRGYLVFVEVKYRSASEKGYALEAVDYRKQLRICRVADYYRMLHDMGDFSPVRFDVVAVCGERVDWFPNAFDYRER